MAQQKNSRTLQREQLREEFWPNEDVWGVDTEKGWFRAPRTLPLILELVASQKLSGNSDPTRVYLELLARHIDSGIIEMTTESEHAFAAGYLGSRGVRSWQERMKVLEKSGFIKTKQAGNQRYKYVLLVHPTVAVQRLYNDGKVSENWWAAYRARQIETKEPSYEQREQTKVDQAAQQAAQAELMAFFQSATKVPSVATPQPAVTETPAVATPQPAVTETPSITAPQPQSE